MRRLHVIKEIATRLPQKPIAPNGHPAMTAVSFSWK